MRTILLLILLAAPTASAQLTVDESPIVATAADADSAFAQGVRAYRQGRFEEARRAFSTVRSAGYTSAELDYNLAETLVRMDSLGAAVASYLRARPAADDSLREAVDHNLRLVRARAGVERDAPFVALPRARWIDVVQTVGPTPFFWAGFVLLVLTCALLGRRYWTGRRSASTRRLLSIIVPLSALLLVIAIAASMQLGVPTRAVLVERVSDAPAASVVHVQRAVASDSLSIRIPTGDVVTAPTAAVRLL